MHDSLRLFHLKQIKLNYFIVIVFTHTRVQVSSGPINSCLMMPPFQTAPILITPSDLNDSNRLTPPKMQMSAMSPISPCILDTELSHDCNRQAKRRISINSDKSTPISKKIMTWLPTTQSNSALPYCSSTDVEPFESKTMQLPAISSKTVLSPLEVERKLVGEEDLIPTRWEYDPSDFLPPIEFGSDEEDFEGENEVRAIKMNKI